MVARGAKNRVVVTRPCRSQNLLQEVLKEFSASRFSLNHYEFVDFTVFEYGQRRQYLQWRVFSFIITTLLTIHVFIADFGGVPGASPFSRFIHMHTWVAVLALVHSFLEVVVLMYTFHRVPSPVLVRIHYTPWQFKILWCMYNIVYPNIMSCNVAYYTIVKNMEVHVGESSFFMALMASFAGIHVSVTATPSRLAHIFQPLMLNIIHFLFTFIYQSYGLIDGMGNNYVYSEIDWFKLRSLAVYPAFVWLLVTCFCHLTMVWCSWFRRITYRGRRDRSLKPIYGFSPEEYYPFVEDKERKDYFEIPLNDEGLETECSNDGQPSKARLIYSPHLSYREISSSWRTETRPGDCKDFMYLEQACSSYMKYNNRRRRSASRKSNRKMGINDTDVSSLEVRTRLRSKKKRTNRRGKSRRKRPRRKDGAAALNNTTRTVGTRADSRERDEFYDFHCRQTTTSSKTVMYVSRGTSPKDDMSNGNNTLMSPRDEQRSFLSDEQERNEESSYASPAKCHSDEDNDSLSESLKVQWDPTSMDTE